MAITIKKESPGRYSAQVTPPHGGGSDWRSPRPMSVDELIGELRQLGCHQTDIGDAFYAADPTWVRNEE